MELPEKVYLVQRIPPDGEKKRYWGFKYIRLYRRRGDIELFKNSNTNSTFKVYEGVVTWKEIVDEDN